MNEILRINNITKRFGDNEVLNELSFSVKKGSVFGFVGKNGTGKTTTMKMILGFLKPNSGNIYVCGKRVIYGNTRTNRYIGYLPDVPEFYDYMTPMEYLKLCGQLSDLNKQKIRIKSEEILELVGLDCKNRRIRGFSRGMKQRLGIAQALLNEPKLLICDEPTSALDPIGRKEILDILLRAKEKTTIVFSTHILSDVERICDTIGILDKGRLVLNGCLKDVRESYRKDKILIECHKVEDAKKLVKLISYISNIQKIDREKTDIIATTTDLKNTGINIFKLIFENNVSIMKYEICEPTLEDVFLEVTS